MKEQISLRESLGTAVNASDLTPDARAVDMLGALGAATHNRYFDTTTGRMQARLSAVGTAEINPRRRMAALLDRAKYGLDRAAVPPAIFLFAHYLRRRGEYARWCAGDGSALIFRFAGMVVVEFLRDRCAQCGGGGQVAVGPMRGRDTQTKICALCKGTGIARVNHGARQRTLDVSHEVYVLHWIERFNQGHAWLQAIEESNIGPLHAQLKRCTLPIVKR